MTEENHTGDKSACTNPDLCAECQEAHAMLMLMLWVGIVTLAFFAFVCTAVLRRKQSRAFQYLTERLSMSDLERIVEVQNLPEVVNPSSPMAMMLEAMNKGASLEQVEKMMDLQERWERREAEKSYNAAFAAFKAEAVKIIKSKKVTDGPLRGKEYAELHDVVNAVTPALSRHGLSTAWKITKDEPQWIEVTCTLKHVGGHSESVSMGGMPDAGGAKNALQARASTKSYLERYTLKAICGVAEGGDDTDGNAPPQQVPLELLAAAREAAMGGWASLAKHIKELSPSDRALLEPASHELKRAAKSADEKGKE